MGLILSLPSGKVVSWFLLRFRSLRYSSWLSSAGKLCSSLQLKSWEKNLFRIEKARNTQYIRISHEKRTLKPSVSKTDDLLPNTYKHKENHRLSVSLSDTKITGWHKLPLWLKAQQQTHAEDSTMHVCQSVCHTSCRRCVRA